MLHIDQIPSLDHPLFTCVVVLVILIIYWKRLKTQYNPIDVIRLPPGPWKLPLLGNLHQLAAGSSLPHHSITDLAKKYGPLMHLKLGEISAVVISSTELAEEVLKTHENAFSQRPTVLATEILSYNLSGVIFSPYNNYWRQMRKVCVLELLSAKRVQSFASIREEEAWNLVESIKHLSQTQGGHHHPINLTEMIFSMQNSITARAALGKKCRYEQEFISLIKESNMLAGGLNIPDLFPSLKFLSYVTRLKPAIEKLHRKMDRMLDEILNDHKLKRKTVTISNNDSGDQQEDLVDVLLQLQESGELQVDVTTNHIKSVTMDMYSAGSETSATTIEWAMAELLRNPRAMEKAQAEVRQLLAGKRKIEEADIKKLDYLKLVIKETLRLHPPVPLIPRQATARCKIRGYDIPSEAKVLINVWAMGRDPKLWANADSFLPERFQGSSIDFRGTNFELIPFGSGRRMCPGISFATVSIELALSQLLYQFNWKLPSGTNFEELNMTECKGLSARKRDELCVIAIPFNPY